MSISLLKALKYVHTYIDVLYTINVWHIPYAHMHTWYNHARMIWIVTCIWHLAANCIKGSGGSGEEGVSFYCTIHIL